MLFVSFIDKNRQLSEKAEKHKWLAEIITENAEQDLSTKREIDFILNP